MPPDHVGTSEAKGFVLLLLQGMELGGNTGAIRWL